VCRRSPALCFPASLSWLVLLERASRRLAAMRTIRGGLHANMCPLRRTLIVAGGPAGRAGVGYLGLLPEVRVLAAPLFAVRRFPAPVRVYGMWIVSMAFSDIVLRYA